MAFCKGVETARWIENRLGQAGLHCRPLTVEQAYSLRVAAEDERQKSVQIISLANAETAVMFYSEDVCAFAGVLTETSDEALETCYRISEEMPARCDDHPDLFLGLHPGLRRLACLTVLHGEQTPVTACCLLSELMTLEPVHLYREANSTTLLWADVAEDKTLFKEICNIMGVYSFCSGFCGPIDSPISARGFMQKAKLAASNAKPGETVDFSSVSWMLLWQQADRILESSGFTYCDFCHPAIVDVARCDREQGTDYIASLSAYLKCGRRLREAAAQLGVHRNTLDYRIRRIEALFDVRLENAGVSFELLFSLFLLQRYGTDALLHPAEKAPFYATKLQGRLWQCLEEAPECPPSDALGRFPLILLNAAGQGENERNALLPKLKELFPNGIIGFSETVICVLLPEAPDAEVLQRLSSLAETAHLRGLYIPACPMAGLGRWIRLCYLLLNNTALLYRDVWILPLFDHLSDLFFLLLQSELNLAPYYSEKVIRIMDTDYEKDSSLSESLYIFLANFMDLPDSAAQAKLHRNTLEYQLKKVIPLIHGIPDEQTRFEMICTYRMLLMSAPNETL